MDLTHALQVRYVCGESRSDVVASIKVSMFRWRVSAISRQVACLRAEAPGECLCAGAFHMSLCHDCADAAAVQPPGL